MGGGTETIGGIEKRDYENIPFFLTRPVQQSMLSVLDDYINVVLNDAKEEGGKKSFLSLGSKDYRNTPKNVYLKKIFADFFECFEDLKQKLKEGAWKNSRFFLKWKLLMKTGLELLDTTEQGEQSENFQITD